MHHAGQPATAHGAEDPGRRAAKDTQAWLRAVSPTLGLLTFDGAAHSVAFEQADEALRLLTETIVPSTHGR